jgi:hypothetical protein
VGREKSMRFSVGQMIIRPTRIKLKKKVHNFFSSSHFSGYLREEITAKATFYAAITTNSMINFV